MKWWTALGVLLGLAVLYVLALVGVSLTSRKKILPPGEPLRFCGFYLDCHLSAAVTGYEVLPGPGGGLLYRVKITFASSAKSATLSVRNPRVELIADDGTRIKPNATPPLLLLPPGGSLEVDFLFPSLTPLVSPLLHLTDGDPMARFTELFLIGDNDSFLHGPVLMAVRK